MTDGGQAGPPSAGKGLTFAHARLREGFIAPQFHLAVIPEHRLFRRRRAPEGPVRIGRRGALRSFAELRTGDIVVHEDHGVARFAGFDTKTVAGVTRDYLNLEFAGTDRVFMPVEQLAKISRYVGGGGEHGPTLSKLGGTRWDTLKARARRAAQDMAGRAAQPLRRAQAPRGPSRSRRTPSGSRSSRTPSPTPRRPISATRSSSSRPTWRRRGRWTA